MQYDLESKLFASASNSKNGEVDANTVFHYHQEGDLVWADYHGGAIVKGH